MSPVTPAGPRYAVLVTVLLAACEPAPDEPIQCRSTIGGEMVFLEPGERLLGPQCPDDLQDVVELVIAAPEGAGFLCYCRDPETLEPVW